MQHINILIKNIIQSIEIIYVYVRRLELLALCEDDYEADNSHRTGDGQCVGDFMMKCD